MRYQVVLVSVRPAQVAVQDPPTTVASVVMTVPVAMLVLRAAEVEGPARRTTLQVDRSGDPGMVADTVETSAGCGVTAMTADVASAPDTSANESARITRSDRRDARWAPL